MVWRLNPRSSSSLIRAQTPSPEERAIRDHDGGARGPTRGGRRVSKPPDDELEEKALGLGGLLVLWEIALDAALFLAAEGRIGDDDIDAIPFADLGELVAERVAGIDLRGVEAVRRRFIWQSRYGSDFGSQPRSERSCRVRRSAAGFHCPARCVDASPGKPPPAHGAARTGSPSRRTVAASLKP